MKTNWILTLTTTVALAVTTAALTAHAGPTQILVVQESLQELLQEYQDFEAYTPSGAGGDITAACEESIFVQWTSAYLNYLQGIPECTPAALGAPLAELGAAYFEAKNDLSSFELKNKGILSAIHGVLVNDCSTNGKVDAQVTMMGMGSPALDFFQQTMNLCLETDFAFKVTSSLSNSNPNPKPKL